MQNLKLLTYNKIPLHYAIADTDDVIFKMFNFLRKQFNLPEPQIVGQGTNSLHGPH